MKRLYHFLAVTIFLLSQAHSASKAQQLLHYWNFNNSTDETTLLTPTSTTGGASLTRINGATSVIQTTSNIDQGFQTLNENARNGDLSGTHLRYNNSVDGTLIFALPTTGYKDVVVAYTTRRSSATNGAGTQVIDYSTDGTNYVNFTSITTDFNAPVLQNLNFSSIAAADNNPNFKLRITFLQGAGGVTGNNRFDNFTMDGTAIPPISLVHYWNFNNSTDETTLLTPTSTVGGASLTRINGATSVIQTTSNIDQGFQTLNENARNGDLSGTHLRYNNSVDGTLIFALPTTGYENVKVMYTTRRSSAANGAGTQVIDYSTDGTNYTNFSSITTDFNAPVLQVFDFTSITATDDNPSFKLRITFLQGAGGVTGNNRFDNFTLDGYSLSGGGDVIPPSVAFSPVNNSVSIPVNVAPTLTFSEDVRLVNNSALDNSNVDNLVELRLSNSSGASVSFDASVAGRIITVTPNGPLLNNQLYYLAIKDNVVEDLSDNALTTVQSVSFTTIAPQTVFAPGDMVFVAYRTNASTPDEVAILTFVNILPGTLINFTDAKYTDNVQPQCTGGFAWTAPPAGVAAGSVISISVDSPFSASVGTVSGASFGLSSGGEQVMVYTGTAANPSFITAMSTNAWLTTTTTTCSGSLSKLPAGLTDGTTSLNTSAAPGNVAGIAVNAHFNGIQIGTPGQLRAAILDPANWIAVGAGTPAQTWPTWTFPGPPYVVSAQVLSQTSLQFEFSTLLDNASATNLSNYTGIPGLLSANLEADNKRVTLVFSTPFTPGSSSTLVVSGVQDAQGRTMFAPYTFDFTYNTFISFDKKFVSVDEGAGSIAIKIKLQNPSTSSVELVVKGTPFSTAGANDFTLATQTLNFTGSSPVEQTITIPISNDTEGEQDEYIALSLENATGAAVTGGNFMTIFIKDNDRLAPVANKEIELSHVGSFDPGSSTAEIVVHDPASQRLFIISSVQDRLDIADFSNPAAITLITSIDMSPYGGITSVASRNGIVAVSSPNANEQANGSVVFFNTSGVFQKQVTVGALPDMVTFSPDGTKVLTANEGQPNDAYTVDPEGSVSIIDISGGIAGLDDTKVTTLLFQSFNAQEAALIASGIRKLKASSTLSQDFEPEFVTVAADSKKAWVTLQENNAIAEINLETKTITSVWALGKKDIAALGNGIDASDNSGIVTIANWPIKAFYIPDGVANYTAAGTQYIVTANEGDEKEYGGLNERTTVGAVTLDPVVFPHGAFLKESHNLGRLRMSNLSGDTDGDGDYDELNVVGSRSFTIWNATTKTKVYDSGDDFEKFTSTDPSVAAIFNADNGGNGIKNRSRAKGPEPEGIAIASINGKSYAFIALERVGGVMVYDITDPLQVKFVDYKNTRSLVSFTGDHGPEGITYISRENSPNGKAYIAVANEISGTVSIYEILPTPKLDQSITFAALTDKTVGDAPFALAATATSGLSVVYTADGSEVTVSGNQVTLVNAGRVMLKANQPGNASYNPAVEVSQSFCVNPAKPSISLQAENSESPVLQSTALTGNQWYKDGVLLSGETGTTLAALSVGSYTVQSTVETCIGSASDPFVLVITGDLAESQVQFAIYPNPAVHSLMVQLPGEGRKTVELFQSTGTLQHSLTTERSAEEIDIQTWSEGMYLIRVHTSQGNYVGKFIKK